MVSSLVSTLTVASTLSSMALLAPTATAHQVVLLPAPQWKTDNRDTQHDPLAFLESQGFKTQQDFTAWRNENGYKSLRDFMDRAKYTVRNGADFKCGYTDPNGTPQPIPAGNAMRSTGYTHDGPCEVWIDDTMVMEGDNCHEKFPGKGYTIDYSPCKGKCTLYWYWLGVRFLKNSYSWQVYKECIPLAGSGGAPGPTSSMPGESGSQKEQNQQGGEMDQKEKMDHKYEMDQNEQNGEKDHKDQMDHKDEMDQKEKMDHTYNMNQKNLRN